MIKRLFYVVKHVVVFFILTVLTQVGGVVYMLSIVFVRGMKHKTWYKRSVAWATFLLLYLLVTYVVVPTVAPLFGREKIKHSEAIQPTTYLTVLLNRNYVRPQMNNILEAVESRVKGSGIQINYLDANFPFWNGFPLLPHLSHNDGRKLDVSLVYQTPEGKLSKKQKSNTGYGAFVAPKDKEFDQARVCKNKGYFQYDYPQYLSFGSKNKELVFSEQGTKQLIRAFLKEASLQKMFIEPHLKTRLGLKDSRIRFQGCRSVRHDDHIHIQLK